MSKKILINCSNLHAGGGVAVATSFIDCLSRMDISYFDVSLLLSTEVMANLLSLETNLQSFESVQIVDYYGLEALWKGLSSHFEDIDLVFTVFGPAYFLRSKTKHLFGFAQPNILYPDNLYSLHLPALQRLKVKLKFKLQELFYSRADSFVVELDHVKRGLENRFFFKNKDISIVSSSVHSVFKNTNDWSNIELPHSNAMLKLGLVSRNYPHKNLKILPKVKKELLERYNLAVDFFVTFPQKEWDKCDDSFKESVINVGGLKLNECPSFYSSLDGVVFPSLLECFSAVPIETMMLNKPLFASDLPFIRDVCAKHCNYFDPLDEVSIADAIYKYFILPRANQESFTRSAFTFVQNYPNPNERAVGYLKLIDSHLTI